MKKRLASILLTLAMIFSLLPTAAFAAGGDYEIDITATKFSTVQYNGKDTMKLDFMLKTNNGAQVRGIQTALISVDLEKYDILQWVNSTVYNRTNTVATGSTVVKDYSYTKYYDAVNDIGVTAKNAFKSSGTDMLMTFEADFGANDVSINERTSIMSVLLGLKDGVDWDELTKDSVRLATSSEASSFNATGVVTIGGTQGDSYVYLPANGSSDTLTSAPELAPDNSFEFVKGAYSGAAATISNVAKVGDNVVVTAAVPNGETAQYGYSATNDAAAVTNWQDSNTFAMPAVGTYYFFARVKENGDHLAGGESTGSSFTVYGALSLSYTAPASMTIGAAISDMTPAVGGGSGSYSYAVTSGTLPTGLSLNASTGVISGTPAEACGASSVTVTVTDSASNTKDAVINFPAVEKKTNTVTFTAPASQFVFGQSVSFTATATNGAPSYTYQKSGEDSWSNVAPTAVGSYKVKATVAESAQYKEGVAIHEFSIIAKTVTSITVTPPTKTTYVVGQSLDTAGMVITAYYNDSTNAPVAIGDANITGFDSSAPANSQTVTVTYGGQSDSFNVTIEAKALQSIAVTTAPSKTTGYKAFETLDATGMVVTATYNSGAEVVAAGQYTISYVNGDSFRAGDTKAVVNFGGKTADVTVAAIGKATLDVSGVSWTGADSVPYDGQAHSVTLTGLPAGLNVTGYTDNEKTYVGTYTAKATLSYDTANYELSASIADKSWSITAAAQTITATDKTIIKNGVGVDISNWASSNAAGANLVYALVGNPTGITLNGTTLTAANADSTASSFTVKVNSATVNVGGNGDPEYSAAAEKTITVTVTAKADADVNITAAPTSKTYGDVNFTLTATKDDAATGGTWAWTSSDSDILEIVSGANTATATIAVKKADATGATITVSYTSDTHYDDDDVTIKVDPKTLTKADLEYTGAAITKVYDGNTTCNVTSVSVKAGVLVGQDVLPINGTAVYNSVDVATANKVTFTPNAITTGNYALASSETLEISAAITKATLTVEGTASASAVYGTKLKDIAVSGLTAKFGASPVAGTWTFSGETVLDVGSAASQTATFTPATGAGNYNQLTKEIVPTITQATYGNQTANGSAKYGAAGTVDLTSLIVEGGTAAYQSHTNSNSALDGTPSVSGKTLNFQFVDNAALATKTENIVVKVTSNNYADYTITVTVTVESKTTPTVTAPTAKTGLVYNGNAQVLINAGSTTGGQLQYSLTSGSDYSTELPKATNAGSYTVYYKVVGDANYADVAENNFSVTIGKKAVTVAPKNASITKGNAIPTFELAYTGLVGSDTLTPNTAATFTCFEADGTTAVSTSTAAGTYTITWTNKDSVTFTGVENYDVTKNATGTLTINNPSYGGGGGYYPPTYSITVENTKNGTISISPKSAVKGNTVTITVDPDKGYTLETLSVTDKNGKEIEVSAKNGKYTFTMPASKVTVKATFMEDNTMLNYFVDVFATDYYYDAILWAVEEGITNGTSATTFSPGADCTRAQMATFLWRAAGSPEPTGKTNPFADIAADAYYAKAVQWAYEQGITGGTSATTFSPDATCTRAQMATFLCRMADGKAVSSTNAFTDVKADAYYAEAVQWAVENDITNGTSATTFSPDVVCTRGQMVTFLYRFFVK